LEQDEAGDEKIFFEYLGYAYKAFLDGDDDRYNQLEKELVLAFDERNQEVERQCEEVEAKIAQMKEQMQECHERR